jgi:hypothetical protein
MSDPEGPQEILAAEALGFTPRSVNLANRMYGLFRLRRYASALEVAERLFQEDDHEAWLWDWRTDPENTTILRVNAHPMLCSLRSISRRRLVIALRRTCGLLGPKYLG